MLKRFFPVPLRWLGALTLVVVAATTSSGQQDNVSFERMKKDIFFLAGPECEGRDTGSKGFDLAAEYVVKQITAAGLKPAQKDGNWYQSFVLGAGGKGGVAGTSTISIKGPAGQTVDLQVDKDFKVLPGLGSGKVAGDLVFAGYGVTVPAGAGKAADDKKKDTFEISFQKKGGKGGKGDDPQKKADETQPPVTSEGYDDFKGVDIKGKIVVVLRRVPRWDNETEQFGGDKAAFAGLEKKITACEQGGAAAVIVVNDRSEAGKGDEFMAAGSPKAGIPVIQLRRSVLDMMLVSGKGTTLADIEKDIDRDLKPRSGPITGWTGSIATTTKQASIVAKNIIATLEGSGPLANEIVVVSAHLDHLGMKGAKAGEKGTMYPGADDNGSGSTTIMELARRFGAIKNRQGRRLVFMWFAGEEKGLLGSKAYCKDPIYPLKDTIACMNMDMIGRLKEGENPELFAEGFNSGKGMPEMLERINKEYGFKLAGPHPQGIFGRSDQASFYAKGVPGMFFFTDFHKDYHKPGDTPDKINVAGMVKICGLMEKIIAELSTQKERPEFVAGVIKAGAGLPGGAKGKKAGKLSLTPDASDKTDKGTLVESVAKGGAAEKAGIQAGDRIMSLGGKSTSNPNLYLQVVAGLTPGTAIEAVIMRGDKELKLKVTPD